MANRGQLTSDLVQVIERQHQAQLSTDRSTTILRFVPYVYDCAVHSRYLDPSQISATERGIFFEWKTLGWVDGGASGRVTMTEDFADFCMKVLFRGYIDYENREVGYVLKDEDRPEGTVEC